MAPLQTLDDLGEAFLPLQRPASSNNRPDAAATVSALAMI